ncbi:hypothetical protein AVEN_218907-1 [Araneus ventricosus]|uniref:Uncharacterized protein n=1 Tax=Araneus ventricosus TaxID=182803 RepID=A0A4Y2P7G5_ARAVE|nr:hypothetical protein AVEN_218907-1 [Araneus ventricosus]
MTDRHDFIGHCGLRIRVPITSSSCDDSPPIIPGYDPSSEVGLKNHTAITVSTKAARTCLIIRQFLIHILLYAGILGLNMRLYKNEEIRDNVI